MRKILLDADLADYFTQHENLTGESPSTLIRKLMRRPAKEEPKPTERIKPLVAPPEIATESYSEKIVSTQITKSNSVVRPPGKSPTRKGIRTTLGAKNTLQTFLGILAKLYNQHQESFHWIRRVRGRKRIYFAKEREEFEASGTSTFQVSIPGTPWWTTSNTSTNRKISILREVFEVLGVAIPQQKEFLERLTLNDKSKNIPFPDLTDADPGNNDEEHEDPLMI
tara:strand:- start:6081 stop:6752 length:672 start_codon:yes stop_codon:yes gene_type:complete